MGYSNTSMVLLYCTKVEQNLTLQCFCTHTTLAWSCVQPLKRRVYGHYGSHWVGPGVGQGCFTGSPSENGCAPQPHPLLGRKTVLKNLDRQWKNLAVGLSGPASSWCTKFCLNYQDSAAWQSYVKPHTDTGTSTREAGNLWYCLVHSWFDMKMWWGGGSHACNNDLPLTATQLAGSRSPTHCVT